MSKQPGVREAKESLAEVRARKIELVSAMLVPDWYWWLLAAVSLLLGAAVDTHHHGLIIGVAVGYGVIVVGASLWMIVGRGRAQLSRQLVGSRESMLIVGFVWLVVGGTIGIAFGLRAEGVPDPALFGCTFCAAALVGGGHALMRFLRSSMLAHGLGG